jgi:TRAP-type C4-dicarboxylate transport system permease small subunit
MLEKITCYLHKLTFPSSRVFGIAGAWLLPVLVVVTVADVVMRRFFNSPIPGAFEISGLILGIVVFLTLAYCAIDGGHVEVDLLVTRFSLKMQRGIVSVMYFLSAILLGLMTWQLFELAVRVMDMNESTVILSIRLYPFLFIAAIGIALLALVFLVLALKNLRGGSPK